MKVEILAVSYYPDKPWLIHCLNSIDKFAKGFSGTAVLVPKQEEHLFSDITNRCRLITYKRADNKDLWHRDQIQPHSDKQRKRAVLHIIQR